MDDSPLRHHLTNERVQAVDGWISPPTGPGLGVTLDEDFVVKYLVDESGRDEVISGANGQRITEPSTLFVNGS